ncbi:SCF complex F-box protein MET30 [Metschnikowia bicuspidata var. bicuspidata NRRL YB-4993]|uniref:SCF complex F-box protein MET30 n=1 Tax=Metschnikowia bicuspidata var. bicuspidata NRRL YB-4993 TaxID=869754 RepID=A0A1A0H708_9ASCO|nr:SCF complex F-box protein MET30 [Metschnikowia bicuspidata var. bicuspidata NRRL YB-4993]OBA19683.1 SCF complex F-box protein MET30 [Metschnikowia bicuspidata var. bicuspidata NRRL YB-4993]
MDQVSCCVPRQKPDEKSLPRQPEGPQHTPLPTEFWCEHSPETQNEIPTQPPTKRSSSALEAENPALRQGQNESVVTPFLLEHIDDQSNIPKDNIHKFCYRHNPDIACNKQADVVKMESIQSCLELLPPRDREAISHVWLIFSAAPHPQRALMLKGLVSQCCFPQLSTISQEINQLIRIDFIATLPVEISLKILCYLDCKSLCEAAQVSRKWKELADDDRVWHHMCEQHIDRKCPNCGWGLPLMHMRRARERLQGTEHDPKRRKGDAATIVKKRPWKSVYSERYQLEKNWRKGTYKITEFIGHTDGITCLQFNTKILILGLYDSAVRVWNIDTGECIRTLMGHSTGVRSLSFDCHKLITGGYDSTIKVWNYRTGECISTYRGHENTVCSVDSLNRTIVSGSADSTVKVWHVDTRTCYTLRGHTECVNSVKYHEPSNTVFSASDDTTVRMWDLNTNLCIRVFGGLGNKGHVGQIETVIPFVYKFDDLVVDKLESDAEEALSLTQQQYEHQQQIQQQQTEQELRTLSLSTALTTPEFVENPDYPTHLLTSSLDNTIKLWDVKTGKCIRTQFGHIEGVWSISADTFRIVSGAHDKLIKVWDLQNGKCLHTFGNDSSVISVALSSNRFVAGLENGKIKMYNFE